jgi:rfaE bifunctional protein kinase chain/domain
MVGVIIAPTFFLMASQLEDIIRAFSGRRVLVIGDAVADQFLTGRIARVSREAPVFIMDHEKTVTVPGGAANVAANIASLGGSSSIIGMIGNDENGRSLSEALTASGVDTSGLIANEGETTITKVRVIAGHQYASRQQVIRIDYLNKAGRSDAGRQKMHEECMNAARDADAVIISDYGYGTVSGELYADIRELAHSRAIPLTVDSRHDLASFRGAVSATPNREEVAEILGNDFSPADCSSLRERLGLRALLLTNGNKGMSLYQEEGSTIDIPAYGPTEPVDVTGAGDTVIAAYTLALASGASFEQAARLANICGGLAVMKKGTAAVPSAELLNAVRSL